MSHLQVQLGLQVPEELLLQQPLLTSPPGKTHYCFLYFFVILKLYSSPAPSSPLVQVEHSMGKAHKTKETNGQTAEDHA